MYIIAVVSGGMDSVTLLYDLVNQRHRVDVLSFNYNQRHGKEIEFCRLHARAVGCRFDVLDISSLQPLLSGSALTDLSVDVPEGHYAAETMRATVVPNRNAIFLSIAFAVAISRQADAVAVGIHTGDHYIYPDCRPEFVHALNDALTLGMVGHAKPGLRIIAPYINLDKAGIAAIGKKIGVPYHLTWTCYKGGDVHCGVCGACNERREAFNIAGVNDLTVYQEVCNVHNQQAL